jgi:hypothetical protein
MNTVLRLTYLHFAAAAWQRWLLVPGIAITVVCLAYFPTNQRWAYLPALALIGAAALFLGSTLMPVMMYRINRSHASCALPFGRAKLLASALLTTVLVTTPLPIIMAQTMRATFPQYGALSLLEFMQSLLFAQIYAAIFLVCSWLYFILYLLGDYDRAESKSRGVVWVILIVAVIPMLPKSLFRVDPIQPNHSLLAIVVASWTVFSLYIVYRPTLRDLENRLRLRFANLIKQHPAQANTSLSTANRREVEIALGMGRRWIGFVIVLAFIAIGVLNLDGNAGARLYTIALFTMLVGAMAGAVPWKSRALWLRQPWTRDVMFTHIERAVFRRFVMSITALLCWTATAGIYGELTVARIIAGVSLIALIATTCIYLGLLQTRGARWSDICVGGAIVVPALAMAAYAWRPDAEIIYVVIFDTAYLAIALAVRHWVQQRWRNIDWLMCRSQRIR